MEALGLIETNGLIAAVEAADAMLKAANVKLLEKTYVGGSLVSIAITGDVGAVKAAVEAGSTAVEKLGNSLLISSHVIPRPDREIESLICIVAEKIQAEEVLEIEIEEVVVEEEKEEQEQEQEDISNVENTVEESNIYDVKDDSNPSVNLDYNNLNKEAIDKVFKEHGLKDTIEALKKTTVASLKKLASEYGDFGMKSSKISKINKKQLIGEFKKYYENN